MQLPPFPSSSGWRAFPLLGGFLRLVGGVVDGAHACARRADLSDHQDPRAVLACCLEAVKDAVFMVAADRVVALERVDRARVDRFPCQHGYLSSGTRRRPQPPEVFLEAGHDDDKQLPVARSAHVVWVDRKISGEALVEAVSSSAFEAGDHFGWVACDNRTTRAVAKIFRDDFKIPRKSIKAQAYWVA